MYFKDTLIRMMSTTGNQRSTLSWAATQLGAGYFGFLLAPKLLTDNMFTTPYLTWPLHFNEGQYNLAAYTYGYIQDKDFTAYVQNGQVADMKINLIIGVNVTLDILFKKESIITPTAENMSARVRLFNDQGQMVAEWMSSEGTYVDKTGHAIAANGVLPATGGIDAVGTGVNPLYPFADNTSIRLSVSSRHQRPA